MPDAAIPIQVDLLSEIERLKLESRGLRGDLAKQFASDAAPADDAGYRLLKFHAPARATAATARPR